MRVTQGWFLALAVSWPTTAFAQVDGGADASDATPPPADADAGGTLSCNLHTPFDGDEQCILPPAAPSFQLRYGPTDYDDPGAVGSYLLAPGTEEVSCTFLKSPNTQAVFAREFHFRARPGIFDASLWRLPAARTDSTAPEACGPLAGAVPLVSVRQTSADSSFGDAPENVGLAWEVQPGTQLAIRMHSINVLDHPMLTEAWLNVVAADPQTITQRPGGLDARARGDDVPPAQTVLHSFACPVPGELRVLEMTGYASAAVTQLRIRVRRADGSLELVYGSYDWHEPIVLRYDSVTVNPTPNEATKQSGGVSGLLNLHQGDSLEWECEFQNATSQTLRYGSGGVYDSAECDVRGVVVRSDGTGWTCFDDKRPPDAGTGVAGSPGSGGRASLPPDGSVAGSAGRGGAGGRTGSSTGGVGPTTSTDGGQAAAAPTTEGGCGCRVSSDTQREQSGTAAVLLLLGLTARRAGRRRSRFRTTSA